MLIQKAVAARPQLKWFQVITFFSFGGKPSTSERHYHLTDRLSIKELTVGPDSQQPGIRGKMKKTQTDRGFRSMELTLKTWARWEDAAWDELTPIYREAFPHGAKPVWLLRRMVNQGNACLHGGYRSGQAVALAITGFGGAGDGSKLILDYFAIRRDIRGQGVGGLFFAALREWAESDRQISAILLEAESSDSPEDAARIRFWEHRGFTVSAHTQRYAGLSRPYRALQLPLTPAADKADNGQEWLAEIKAFHWLSFRRKRQGRRPCGRHS